MAFRPRLLLIFARQLLVSTAFYSVFYVLPQWLEFLSANDVAQQTARLRSTLGEGPRVRVGFTKLMLERPVASGNVRGRSANRRMASELRVVGRVGVNAGTVPPM